MFEVEVLDALSLALISSSKVHPAVTSSPSFLGSQSTDALEEAYSKQLVTTSYHKIPQALRPLNCDSTWSCSVHKARKLYCEITASIESNASMCLRTI